MSKSTVYQISYTTGAKSSMVHGFLLVPSRQRNENVYFLTYSAGPLEQERRHRPLMSWERPESSGSLFEEMEVDAVRTKQYSEGEFSVQSIKKIGISKDVQTFVKVAKMVARFQHSDSWSWMKDVMNSMMYQNGFKVLNELEMIGDDSHLCSV